MYRTLLPDPVVIETPRESVSAYLQRFGWLQTEFGIPGGAMCLHGAIRHCSKIPGDAEIIEQVASCWGRGPDWNDDTETTLELVLYSLEHEPQWSIGTGELHATFGPNWRNVVQVIRQCSRITLGQVQELESIYKNRKLWKYFHLLIGTAARHDRTSLSVRAMLAALNAVENAILNQKHFRKSYEFGALLASIYDLAGLGQLDQQVVDLFEQAWVETVGPIAVP